jgi:phage major head subunit gpT-like protein
MQINATNLAALFKGYRTAFLAEYHGATPMWQKVAMKTASSSEQEIYHWLGSFPGMRKLVDEIQIQNLSAHKFAITNDEFESTIAIPQATIERDTYGIYTPNFTAMGRAAGYHPDELVSALLLDGFTELCYTGSAFFADAHEPVSGGTTFDNKTTKKLSRANFRTARANIKSRLNSKGKPMGLGIKLQLIVSPTNESLAREILVAERVDAGNSNVDFNTAELVVWPALATSEYAWFLVETGLPLKPLIFQEEKPVGMTALTSATDEHVFKKHEFLYQAYGRYGAGYGLPELAYGSTGADAA